MGLSLIQKYGFQNYFLNNNNINTNKMIVKAICNLPFKYNFRSSKWIEGLIMCFLIQI